MENQMIIKKVPLEEFLSIHHLLGTSGRGDRQEG